MVNIASHQWDSNPTITVGLAYDRRRSGSDMQYRVKVTVEPVSGASYFGYSLYCDIDLAGKSKISAHKLKGAHPSQWSDAIVYTTDWLTVPDRSSGTVQLDVTIYSKDGYNRTRTYSHRLTVDPGASTVSAADGTLGVSQTISVTRYVSGSTHNISFRCGNTLESIVRNSASTYISWTPPVSLASENTKGSNVSVQLEIATYKNGEKLGDTQVTIIRCAIPSSVKPTASLTLSDAMGYAQNYGGYVQGQSKLKAVLSGSGSYGSTIRGYSIKAPGETASASTLTVDLPASGDVTITGTVTDTRSRTGKDTKTVRVLPYQRPHITRMVEGRCDSNGTPNAKGDHCKVTFTAVVEPLQNRNSASYKLLYKPTDTEYWTETSISATGYNPTASVIFSASIDAAYDLRISATDAFGTSYSTIHTLPRAYQIIDTDGDALGFGQRCEDPHTAAFGMEVRVNSGLTKGGKSLVDWSPVTVTTEKDPGYTCIITDGSEQLPGQGLVLLNLTADITVKTTQTPADKIAIATVSPPPKRDTAVTIYAQSNNPRRFNGKIYANGTLVIRPSVDMGAATYSIDISGLYRTKE